MAPPTPKSGPIPRQPALEQAVGSTSGMRSASGERYFCISRAAAGAAPSRRSSSATSGRNLRLQRVGGVQLAEQADHLLLRRRVVAEALHRVVPQLHAGAAVHQADDVVRRELKRCMRPSAVLDACQVSPRR